MNLPDPYVNEDYDAMWRLNFRISKADHDLMRTVFIERGVFNNIVTNTIANICNELRKHSITHYSPDIEQLRDAIIHDRVMRPFNIAYEESPGHDGDRTSDVRGTDEDTSIKSAYDAQSPSRRSVKGKGGSKAKGERSEKGKHSK
jgi:hypothetical protein